MNLLLAAKLPVHIASTLNARMHWRELAAKAKQQRETTRLILRSATPFDPARLPVIVTLTRFAPRDLDDDNLAGGFKSVRDGVADWLGIDDRDPRVQWRYRQKRSTQPRTYSALVEVEFE